MEPDIIFPVLPKTILVTDKTNIKYLSGFSGSSGYLILAGRSFNEGWLFTDARYHLVAKSVLPKSIRIIDSTAGFSEAWKKFLKKKRVARVGFEGGGMNYGFWKHLKKISRGTKLIDIGGALDEKRIIKKTILNCLLVKSLLSISSKSSFAILK